MAKIELELFDSKKTSALYGISEGLLFKDECHLPTQCKTATYFPFLIFALLII